MARTQGSHSDTTRRNIRLAALKLFAQHGFAAVSMRQIAGAVGVQAGTLYNYTPDKQSLLFELMHSHMQELLLALEDLPKDGSPLAQLQAFVRFHIGFHLDRPEAVFIAYMELRNLTDENFAKIEALRRTYENRLQAIIDAGQSAGDFRVSDAKISTLAVIAMMTGVTTWYKDHGRLSRRQVEDIYCGLVAEAMGAVPELSAAE